MTLSHGPLGQSVAYASQYDPSLFPIARSHNRAALDLHAGALPFAGVDLWNAYELSWLDAKGKPRVAMATFSVPADSPNIIESKSFKLYLNSFNQTRLVNSAALRGRLERDLSAAAGAPVGLDFILPQRFGELRMGELDGIYIDKLDIEIDTYEPRARAAAHAARRCRRGDAVLAAAEIELPGHRPARLGQRADPLSRRADRPRSAAALRDLVPPARGIPRALRGAHLHRHHGGLPAELLTVYARYTRRGGLDINPWRSNFEAAPPPDVRTVRQ